MSNERRYTIEEVRGTIKRRLLASVFKEEFGRILLTEEEFGRVDDEHLRHAADTADHIARALEALPTPRVFERKVWGYHGINMIEKVPHPTKILSDEKSAHFPFPFTLSVREGHE